MFGSKNAYFSSNSKEKLLNDLDLLIDFLKFSKRSEALIDLYVGAFIFFMDNPHRYDGATLSEDLDPSWINLDYRAMLHDYLYIIGCNADYEQIDVANYIYYHEMRQDGIPGVYINWQRFRLAIFSYPFVLINKIKGKKKSEKIVIKKSVAKWSVYLRTEKKKADENKLKNL